MGLVDYGSSSEDEDVKNNNNVVSEAPPATTKPGSSLFSALPAPKQGKIQTNNEPNKKKEVTVKIPIASSVTSKKDDDDEWEEDAGTGPEKKRRLNSGIASALSFLPAPKNEITKPAPQKIEPKPSVTPTIPKPSAPLLKAEFNEKEEDSTTASESSTKNAQPATTSSIPAPNQTNGKKPPIKAKTSAQPQRRIALSFKQQAFAELLKSQPEDEPPQDEQPAEIQEPSNEEAPPETVQDPSYLPPYQDGTDPTQAQGYYDQSYYGQQQYAQYGYPSAPKAPPVDPRTLPRAFREMLQSGNTDFTEVKQDNLRHSFFNYSAPDTETFYKPRPAMEEGLTHNHKRQNHASYLVWDLQNKMASLEQKRADSRRTKMESRSKYGW